MPHFVNMMNLNLGSCDLLLMFIVDYLVFQHSYDLKDFPLSLKDGVHSYIKIHGYYA